MKIDIHNHILPESWPDLKEVNKHVFCPLFKKVKTTVQLPQKYEVNFISQFWIFLLCELTGAPLMPLLDQILLAS